MAIKIKHEPSLLFEMIAIRLPMNSKALTFCCEFTVWQQRFHVNSEACLVFRQNRQASHFRFISYPGAQILSVVILCFGWLDFRGFLIPFFLPCQTCR